MKIDILLYIDDPITESDLYFNGMSIPEKLYADFKNISLVNEVFFSVPESFIGKIELKNCLIRKRIDDVLFWKEIFTRTESDHIIKIIADSPFLDCTVIKEMIDLHIEYLSEFTFSENLPIGFSSIIIAKSLIEAVPNFEEKTLPLVDVVKSNINQFDVEIYYKDPDIRDKRISFLSRNKRDRIIMENIFSKNNGVPAYGDVKKIIDNNPEMLYIGPSYLEIELTGSCDLNCIFCYRKYLKESHGNMDLNHFKKIISDMREFDLPYTICFGGSGEPLMHPNFYEILEIVQKENLIENIIIETNGLLADINYKNYLVNNPSKKIKTIININALDSDTYKALHNADYFNQVYQNILSLQESANENIYLQIMKINETEIFLDKYYDFWENLKIPIILQKQNTYLGKIQDRRYSDLSPLDRVPCWHLLRDLYILSDGRVSFCKQDIDGESMKGYISEISLKDIWNNSRGKYLEHYRNNYTVKPDCNACDEWYTFNF